jgi:hypothetical protein
MERVECGVNSIFDMARSPPKPSRGGRVGKSEGECGYTNFGEAVQSSLARSLHVVSTRVTGGFGKVHGTVSIRNDTRTGVLQSRVCIRQPT